MRSPCSYKTMPIHWSIYVALCVWTVVVWRVYGVVIHQWYDTTVILRPFFRNNPGEPVPEENFWTLWRKERLTEADTRTIRLGATPSGLTVPTSTIPHIFLRAGCPSCRPTNSVKALQATSNQWYDRNYLIKLLFDYWRWHCITCCYQCLIENLMTVWWKFCRCTALCNMMTLMSVCVCSDNDIADRQQTDRQ